MTIKDLKYLKIYSVNTLYLSINKVNGYLEEINKNNYLMLVPTNESKEITKKYEELWSKIRDQQYMKIKFNSDDKLPLNKMIHSMIIVVRAGFHKMTKIICN